MYRQEYRSDPEGKTARIQAYKMGGYAQNEKHKPGNYG